MAHRKQYIIDEASRPDYTRPRPEPKRGQGRGRGQVFWPRGRGLFEDLTSLIYIQSFVYTSFKTRNKSRCFTRLFAVNTLWLFLLRTSVSVSLITVGSPLSIAEVKVHHSVGGEFSELAVEMALTSYQTRELSSKSPATRTV